MNKNDRFRLVTKCKEFIVFVNEIIINYPRKEFILKDRLINTSYDLLELIFITNLLEEDRLYKQKLMLTKISMLDFYLEESYHKQCISEKKLNKGCRQIEEMQKMIYGWVNSDESQLSDNA